MTAVFRAVLAMSLSGAALAVMIFLLRALFPGRLKPFVYLLLWGALAVRLIVPFFFESPLSLFNLAPQGVKDAVLPFSTEAPSPRSENEVFSPEITVPNTVGYQSVSDSGQIEKAPEKASVSLYDVLAYVWLGGFSSILLYSILINVIYRARIGRNRRYRGEDFDRAYAEAAKAVGIREKIPAVAVSGLSSPAVCGVFRPRILIPFKTFSALPEKQQAYILTHELMHVKYRDTAWMALMLFINCVHWFNPLVWAARHFAKKDIELLCDTRTVKAAGASPGEYAGVLISVADRMRGRRTTSLVTAAIDKKRDIKWRIRMVLRQKKVSAALSILISALLFAAALIGCTAATSAIGGLTDFTATPVATPAQTQTPSDNTDSPQETSHFSLPINQEYGGELFALPENPSIYGSAAYQKYPDLENWGYTYEITDASPIKLSEIAARMWADYGWKDTKDTYDLNGGYMLFPYDTMAVESIGHSERFWSGDYSFQYMWGVDYSKQDPITFRDIDKDIDAAISETVARLSYVLGTDEYFSGAPETEELSGYRGNGYRLSWIKEEDINVFGRPESVKRVLAEVYGDGIVSLFCENYTAEYTAFSADFAHTPISLEQALYCLNYTRAELTANGVDYGILTRSDAKITDVKLIYISVFSGVFDGINAPAFAFYIDIDGAEYCIYVDCATGNIRSEYNTIDEIFYSPYYEINGEPLPPEPVVVGAPDGGEVLTIETAAKLIEDFTDVVWTSFYTMESPELPGYAIDSVSVHLYLRWADLRLTELEHPYNAREKLSAPPDSEATLTFIEENPQENTALFDVYMMVHQERVASGVNGNGYTGTVEFKYDGGMWKISGLNIDTGIKYYTNLRSSLDAISNPTTKDVDRVVDDAIAYFKKNN